MTSTDFEIDPYPGKPKILFVAPGHSSHTINWIDLFEEAELNIRLFCLPYRMPPDDWPVKAYVVGKLESKHVIESSSRKRRHPLHPVQVPPPPISTRIIRRLRRYVGKPYIPPPPPDLSPEKWLTEIIEGWQPQIIHTLGMTAARYVSNVLEDYEFNLRQPWFITIWGAPDTTLQIANPNKRQTIQNILQQAQWVMSDAQYCIDEVQTIGVGDNQLPPHPILPGAGGIDIDEMHQRWKTHPPSKRRILLWPKFYNTYYMSGLTTLEAIKLCWEQIQPCELVIPTMTGELAMWYHTLPETIKQGTRTFEKIPHDEMLKFMTEARVMLAPSLLDGLPNVLIEAMAAGAFPIMSPLPMFGDILVDGENALLARNLYPQEIAQAIVRAMSDDELVDLAAQHNLNLVKQIAHRPDVRQKAVENYQYAIKAQQNTT